MHPPVKRHRSPRIIVLSSRTAPETLIEQDFRSLSQVLSGQGLQAERHHWQDFGVTWDTAGCGAVIIRGMWYYHLEGVSGLLSALARIARGTLLINPLPWVRWNVHKTYLLDLARAGVPIIPSHFVSAQEASADPHLIARICREGGWRRAVLKPSISANSFMTVLLEEASGYQVDPAVLARIWQFQDRQVILQPFVEAFTQHGEYLAICIGGRFRCALLRPPAASLAPASSHLEQVRTVDLDPRQRAFVQSVLDACAGIHPGLPAPAILRIDFTIQEGEMLLLEVEAFEPWLYPGLTDAAYVALAEAVRRQVDSGTLRTG